MYRGVIPQSLLVGVAHGTRFPVHASSKSTLEKYLPEGSPFIDTISGGLAGGISVFTTQPFDVVKAKMQGEDCHRYRGFFDCCKQTYMTHGLRAFYTGTGPRLTRDVTGVAIIFTVYHKIRVVVESIAH